MRLNDLWEIDAEPPGDRLDLGGDVELRNVGVRYPGSADWAVRDISMTIRRGDHIGIVGQSGSGKSTLVKVLAGLLSPTEGDVLIDGRSSLTLCQQSLRRSIGVVLQDVWLFGGTIEENILVDRETVGADAVLTAARLAAIDADIQSMPLGYRTKLTDGGGGLSGGQRQRLAIARALVTAPQLILLDEATSNLDTTTEAVIADNLDHLGVTRISVTHRLSTIRNCDRVIVLDNGRIVQHGTPAELSESAGAFRDLLNSASSPSR